MRDMSNFDALPLKRQRQEQEEEPMSMKCEYKPDCNKEASYRVELPDIEYGEMIEISICTFHYMRAVSDYEGRVVLRATRKIWFNPKESPWRETK